MFKLKMEIKGNITERQLIDNRRVFTTKPVEVFDTITGHKSTVKESLFEQVKGFYVMLKGKTIGKNVEELCNTIENSMDIEEIMNALEKLGDEIK